MRVSIVPSEVPACEYYRARFAAQFLAEVGQIELVELDSEIRTRIAPRKYGAPEPVGIINPPETDVIVFTRGVLPGRIVDLIPLLQREGIAVVVDVDDDYERLPNVLASLYKINPSLSPLYNWRHVKRACEVADVVTVSTPALLRYQREAVLLRNCIPSCYLEVQRPRRTQPAVGWSGTVRGHPGDLRMTRSGVMDAIADTGAKFVAIGDGDQVREQLSLACDPEITDVVSFEDFPSHVAKLDVGIAPLELNAYSEAKSYLKPLEYMSLGVSWVASPTSEYMLLADELDRWCERNHLEPLGRVVPSKGRVWRKHLTNALRRAEDGRGVVSAATRLFVRENYLVEANAHLWGEAWQKALDRRRS